jgi:hypothetical protein
MKRTVYVLLGSIAVILALLYVILSGNSSPFTNRSQIASSTISEETSVYKISISYPKFGIDAADKFTQSIVDRAVAEFRAIPANPTPVPAKNEMIGAYEVFNSGPEILSAKLELYQYTGGAHGLTVAYGLNFHPDGTVISLEEATAKTGKNLRQISIEASKQLQDRFGLVQFPEGAIATEKNYETFVIGTSTVNFIFQQYQVEAYAAGMPEVSFPRVK